MYTPSAAVIQGGAVLLEPSQGWKLLRTSSYGRSQLQELLRQIFEGLAALHATNVTHRDVKTSNVLWGLRDADSSNNAASDSHLKVILIDFSSAYNSEALRLVFFGPMGPTSDEETLEAMPPERIFADMDSDLIPGAFEHDVGGGDGSDTTVHMIVPSPTGDVWSAGVLFLEILLATRAVFTVDQRTRALLTWEMRHEPKEELERALFVAALGDFCITSPSLPTDDGGTWAHNRRSRRKLGCTARDLLAALHRRDPLELGFDSLLGLDGIDLLLNLLRWRPEDRLTASQALDHPFLSRSSADSRSERGKCLSAPARTDGNAAAQAQQEVSSSCKFPLLAGPKDSGQGFTHSDKFEVGPYICPECGRRFELYNSCLRHAVSRGHGLWCNPTYSPYALEAYGAAAPVDALIDPVRTATLPPCLSSHALLPPDASSGWCDAQGRRKYLEDHTAVVYAAEYSLWSVFDGHLGASASQFAAHYLPPALVRAVDPRRPTAAQVRRAFLETDAALLREQAAESLTFFFNESEPRLESPKFLNASSPANMAWIRQLLNPSRQISSLRLNKRLHRRAATDSSSASTKKAEIGSAILLSAGTTATVALLTRSGVLVVANVGDSRAVLCCCAAGLAVALTAEHTASNPEEKARIEALGGTIVWGRGDGEKRKDGDMARVNGEVSVTRSLGDGHMKNLLTAEPHVTILELSAANSVVSSGIGISETVLNRGLLFEFLVVASDGLWDVMSSDEAVAYVKSRRQHQETWQAVATALTHEALLRGSLDNIGVCVIDLKERKFEAQKLV
jgi:serine/threonine protein phosphatase PrpC/serine/threonine protein kinase